MHHGACRVVHTHAEGAGDVLLEVEHALPCRRADDLGREGLVRDHGQAQTGMQLLRGGSCLLGRQQRSRDRLHRRQRIVDALAVVDVGEGHVGARKLPVLAGADDLLGAVGVRHAQFGDEAPVVAVVAVVALHEAEAARVPAMTQLNGELRAVLNKGGCVVGLVLDPLVKGVRAGGEHLVGHAHAVDAHVIHAQAHHVEARSGNLLALLEGELLGEHGMARLVIVAGEPLGNPRLVQLGRLEPRGIARSLLARVGAHGDGPLIARARSYRHVKRAGLGVKVGPAGIGHDLATTHHHHARCLGPLAGGVFDSPGERGPLAQIEPKRIGDVVNLHAHNSHGILPDATP